MNKTVILLGAGASKAEGAPLQNTLFKSFFEPTDHTELNNHSRARIMKMKNNIKVFFKVFYGINDIFDGETYDSFVFPTFEEALGILEIAIIKEEEYKNQTVNLLELKESLVYLMAKAIENKLDLCNRISGYHNTLISKLMSINLLSEVSFISTNYDLLIDNAILRLGCKPNYGFNDSFDGINLFKVHGSLNWIYCPTCKKIEGIEGQKVMISVYLNQNQIKCEHCNTARKYVIIPPTYFKNYSNNFITNVWNNAEKSLTEANHIVICGYSFPDADIHIKYLIKRAEINRSDNENLTVSVFNYHNEKDESIINEEKLRYKRFLKNTTKLNFYDQVSFEGFIENLDDYLIL